MSKKKKILPPIEERTLALVFESCDDMRQWRAWYVDGGGQESASYNVNWKLSKEDVLIMEGDPGRCPECRSCNILDLADDDSHNVKRIEFIIERNKLKTPKKQYLCEDCHHNFHPPEDE